MNMTEMNGLQHPFMTKIIPRKFSILCVLFVVGIVIVSNGQRFELSSSESPRLARLQVDGANGKVYASVGRQLYRLNMNLELEEARSLTSESLNSSLSTDGRWLVVCLNYLSCEVYNTSNTLSAGPVFRRENVIGSPLNMSLFAAEDSFYVGSFNMEHNQMVLSQYIFTGAQSGSSASMTYDINRADFQRSFFGGFVKGSNAYYLGIDINPRDFRSIRVLRVCHDSNFGALHELSLRCGSNPSLTTRISGIIAVDNFAGVSGTAVVLSRSRPGGSQNSVCVLSLETIDRLIQEKYDSCSAANLNSDTEQFSVAWRSAFEFCRTFLVRTNMQTHAYLYFIIIFIYMQPTQDICRFDISGNTPPALDDVANLTHALSGNRPVFPGSGGVQNFITAMTAAVADSFSFIFVAFIDPIGNNFVTGVSVLMLNDLLTNFINSFVLIQFNIESTSVNLPESDGFGRRAVVDGPVQQLQLNVDTGFMYAITDISVSKIAITGMSVIYCSII